MTVKPVRPQDIAEAKVATFPPAVVRAFNELIAENFSAGSAKFLVETAIARMISLGLSRENISKHGWLGIEEVYRKAGWKVVRDYPGYRESCDAFFEFTPRRSE